MICCFFSQLLSDNELFEVREACDMAIDLNKLKMKVYEYVESRMTFIAPNLSVIVGASTAAKIMGNFFWFNYIHSSKNVFIIYTLFFLFRCSRRINKFIKNACV